MRLFCCYLVMFDGLEFGMCMFGGERGLLAVEAHAGTTAEGGAPTGVLSTSSLARWGECLLHHLYFSTTLTWISLRIFQIRLR